MAEQVDQYVVVAKRKDTGEYEPLHPGWVDKENADKLMAFCAANKVKALTWTQWEWQRYYDKLVDEA